MPKKSFKALLQSKHPTGGEAGEFYIVNCDSGGIDKRKLKVSGLVFKKIGWAIYQEGTAYLEPMELVHLATGLRAVSFAHEERTLGAIALFCRFVKPNEKDTKKICSKEDRHYVQKVIQYFRNYPSPQKKLELEKNLLSC